MLRGGSAWAHPRGPSHPVSVGCWVAGADSGRGLPFGGRSSGPPPAHLPVSPAGPARPAPPAGSPGRISETPRPRLSVGAGRGTVQGPPRRRRRDNGPGQRKQAGSRETRLSRGSRCNTLAGTTASPSAPRPAAPRHCPEGRPTLSVQTPRRDRETAVPAAQGPPFWELRAPRVPGCLQRELSHGDHAPNINLEFLKHQNLQLYNYMNHRKSRLRRSRPCPSDSGISRRR